MTTSLFGDDFPDYRRGPAPRRLRHVDLDKIADQLPGGEADCAHALGELDRTDLSGIILNHLWLVSSKRCACGLRSEAPAGQHYSWWSSHVAGLMVAAGYSSRASL